MEFIVKDVKTGKAEAWHEWAFIAPEANKSEPSNKELTQKDRSIFVQMAQNGKTELESPLNTSGKNYFIVADEYDNAEVQGVVYAWLKHERTIKGLIISIADMCITEKDPHLANKDYEVHESDLLSVYNFVSPFMATSLELAKRGIGFDDIPGETVKWIWIKTLEHQNKEKYEKLINEILEYYNCGV